MIKVVTAFFDIGRGQSPILSRSNDQYFEYFKFWARLKNDLTIYCQSSHAEKALSIRRSFGLEESTHIRIIDNISAIEPKIYKSMQYIEKNEKFNNFRYSNKAISNTADYDYIMLMKWWCLQDAASNENENTMMAWIDFGYNHGGERYSNPTDFDFVWNYPFDAKINAFCLNDPNKMCGIDSLQFQADCFIGHTAIMPAKLTALFWQYIKEAMEALISLDCIDDDQQLMLMVYKKVPELFEIRICDWFEDFVLCSNRTFETRNTQTADIKQWVQKIVHWIKGKRNKDTFIKRSKERKKIYH